MLIAAVVLNWWFGIRDSDPTRETSPKVRIEESSPGYFSVEELADASDVIVVGAFGDVISREIDYGIEDDGSSEDGWGIPLVFHRVEVKEKLKGEPDATIIVARLDGTRIVTDAVKPIEKGKRYLLFLSDATEDAHRFKRYADVDKDIYITLSDDNGVFEVSSDDIAIPREPYLFRKPGNEDTPEFTMDEIRASIVNELPSGPGDGGGLIPEEPIGTPVSVGN